MNSELEVVSPADVVSLARYETSSKCSSIQGSELIQLVCEGGASLFPVGGTVAVTAVAEPTWLVWGRQG